MNYNRELKFHPLSEIINRKDDKGNFVLTPLSYTDDHLEPFIGERTVRYHYYGHLQAYIDKVNSLKGEYPAGVTIEDILTSSKGSTDLYRNASQVFNHYFYFEQFNPKGAKEPLPVTLELIKRHYGSWNNLKSQIVRAGMDMFGSGWAFLTTDKERKCLWARLFSGTGTPLKFEIPILALDVWEHAYYLDVQNKRNAYIHNFFDLIDWSIIEMRLTE